MFGVPVRSDGVGGGGEAPWEVALILTENCPLYISVCWAFDLFDAEQGC